MTHSAPFLSFFFRAGSSNMKKIVGITVAVVVVALLIGAVVAGILLTLGRKKPRTYRICFYLSFYVSSLILFLLCSLSSSFLDSPSCSPDDDYLEVRYGFGTYLKVKKIQISFTKTYTHAEAKAKCNEDGAGLWEVRNKPMFVARPSYARSVLSLID